jgi:hypothetical protein
MPHQVSGEEIADLGTWMIARLAGSDRAAKAANG